MVFGVLTNMPAAPVTLNEATGLKTSLNVTVLPVSPEYIETAAPELITAPLPIVMLAFVLLLSIANADALITLPDDKTTAEPPPLTWPPLNVTVGMGDAPNAPLPMVPFTIT